MKDLSPDIRSSLPGGKTKHIIARNSQVISDSYIKEYLLVIERGEGTLDRIGIVR